MTATDERNRSSILTIWAESRFDSCTLVRILCAAAHATRLAWDGRRGGVSSRAGLLRHPAGAAILTDGTDRPIGRRRHSAAFV